MNAKQQPTPIEFANWILANAHVFFDEFHLICYSYNNQMIGTHELYEIFLKEFNRTNNNEH
mgnify:CR=1 FL=1